MVLMLGLQAQYAEEQTDKKDKILRCNFLKLALSMLGLATSVLHMMDEAPPAMSFPTRIIIGTSCVLIIFINV